MFAQFLNSVWSMGLEEGTPRNLAIATRTFVPLFVLLAAAFTSGVFWPMPLRAFAAAGVGAVIAGFTATTSWASAQKQHRDERHRQDKLLLVELLRAELDARPDPDPTRHLKPAA